MVGSFYVVLFIISSLLLVALMTAFRNKIPFFYVLFFASVVIVNYGYMKQAYVHNVEAAIDSIQTVYLGTVFVPFFINMCISDLCKFKIRRRFQLIFLLIGWTIFGLVCTIGKYDWYYKSVDVEYINGMSIIKKTYGPLHNLYYLYVGGAVVVATFIIIHVFRTRKNVSYHTMVLLLLSQVVTVGVYAVEKLTHTAYTLVPLSFIITEVLTLILLIRITMFDVEGISAKAMIKSKLFGFILIDKSGKYLGCDGEANVWFPELKDIRVDSNISEIDTPLFNQINSWFNRSNKINKAHITSGNLYIELEHVHMHERRYNEVHCVYLHDDTKKREYETLLKKYNETLAQRVTEKADKIQKIQSDIVLSMASIVENRDGNTGGHITRTSSIVKIFTEHLRSKEFADKLTPGMIDDIVQAAPLHDFGKIAIPDRILNKPGKFENDEYDIMKQHAEKGAVIVSQILKNVDDVQLKRVAINVAHYHHEKWDGTGYPEGISGENIPFEARVMALADVFDALVSKRVYKEPLSYDDAFKIIRESGGTHFDPVLCEAFLECRPQLEELYNSFTE